MLTFRAPWDRKDACRSGARKGGRLPNDVRLPLRRYGHGKIYLLPHHLLRFIKTCIVRRRRGKTRPFAVLARAPLITMCHLPG